jgi:hypothetical protein
VSMAVLSVPRVLVELCVPCELREPCVLRLPLVLREPFVLLEPFVSRRFPKVDQDSNGIGEDAAISRRWDGMTSSSTESLCLG